MARGSELPAIHRECAGPGLARFYWQRADTYLSVVPVNTTASATQVPLLSLFHTLVVPQGPLALVPVVWQTMLMRVLPAMVPADA